MNKGIKNDGKERFELLSPKEFVERLGISKSELHEWRAKGWLVPERHFIKIDSIVRYFWSESRLIEIHQNCNREKNTKVPKPAMTESPKSTSRGTTPQVNWEY